MSFANFDDMLRQLLGVDLGGQSITSITADGGGPWLRLLELHDDPATSSTPPPPADGQLRFWHYQPDGSGGGRMRWAAVAITDGDTLGQAQTTWSGLPQRLAPLVGPGSASVVSPEDLRNNRDVLAAATDYAGTQMDDVQRDADQLTANRQLFDGTAYKAFVGRLQDVVGGLQGAREQFAQFSGKADAVVKAADYLERALQQTVGALGGPWGTPDDGLSRVMNVATLSWGPAPVTSSITPGSVNGTDLKGQGSETLLIASSEWNGAGPFDVLDAASWPAIDRLTRQAWGRHVTEVVKPLLDAANAYDAALADAAGESQPNQQGSGGNNSTGSDDEPPPSEPPPGQDSSTTDTGGGSNDGGTGGGTGQDGTTSDTGGGSNDGGTGGATGQDGMTSDTGGGSNDGGTGGATGQDGWASVTAGSTDGGAGSAWGQDGCPVGAGGSTDGSGGSDSGWSQGDQAGSGWAVGAPVGVPVGSGQTSKSMDGGPFAGSDASDLTLGELTTDQIQALRGSNGLAGDPLTPDMRDELARRGLPVTAAQTLGDLSPNQLNTLHDGGLLDGVSVTDEQRALLGLPGDGAGGAGASGAPPLGVATSAYPTAVNGVQVGSAIPASPSLGPLSHHDVHMPTTRAGAGGVVKPFGPPVAGPAYAPGLLAVGASGYVPLGGATGGPDGAAAPMMPMVGGGATTGPQSRDRDRWTSHRPADAGDDWGADDCAPAVVGRTDGQPQPSTPDRSGGQAGGPGPSSGGARRTRWDRG